MQHKKRIVIFCLVVSLASVTIGALLVLSSGQNNHDQVISIACSQDLDIPITGLPHPNSKIAGTFSEVHNLSHVVVKTGEEEHHIFSAYYDSRSTLPRRPAVVLLGYTKRRHGTSFFCKLLYSDNSTKCRAASSAPLIVKEVWPESYFCMVNPGEMVPLHVSLSTDRDCEAPCSSPIPVWNRDNVTPEGVGVCVHGCVYTTDGSSKKVFRDLVQFLAMVQVLGAKVVTVYNLNIDHSVWEQILLLYPNFVDVVQWVDLNNTMHYYGQRILINDCLYRNMKRVKYLAMIDLDEMIFPVSTNSWPDMLKVLDKSRTHKSFTFSNNFFAEEDEPRFDEKSCPRLTIPKYFVRLNRLPWPQDRQNTKMKMIIKPELLSSACIHDVCSVRDNARTYSVPKSLGLMAHYREPVQTWYMFGPGEEDRTAIRFQREVDALMKKRCSTIANSTKMSN